MEGVHKLRQTLLAAVARENEKNFAVAAFVVCWLLLGAIPVFWITFFALSVALALLVFCLFWIGVILGVFIFALFVTLSLSAFGALWFACLICVSRYALRSIRRRTEGDDESSLRRLRDHVD